MRCHAKFRGAKITNFAPLNWPGTLRGFHEKARGQCVESGDSLRQYALRIVAGGNPEGGIERSATEKPGGGFRVHRLEYPLRGQPLNCALCRLKTAALARPLRWIAQDSRSVEQNNALHFWDKCHLDIGGTLGQQALPRVCRTGADLLRAQSHVGVDLVDDRGQEAALVAKLW